MTVPCDDLAAWIDTCIAQTGWAALAVFADDEGGTPAFTYSIGFQETLGTPEVLLVGFDSRTSHTVLAAIYDAVSNDRITLAYRKADLSDVIQDFDIRTVPVNADIAANTALAAHARSGDPVPLLQVLLPDPSGHLPGDENCDPDFIAAQSIHAFRNKARDN